MYVILVHDADEGANIGGGIGIIGSGLAIVALLVSVVARGRSRGQQLAASICAALLLLAALSFLTLDRPFD